MAKTPDIKAPMTDNQTSNTCPDCGKEWFDKVPIPGLLHRTRLCEKCYKKVKEKNGKDMGTSTT